MTLYVDDRFRGLIAGEHFQKTKITFYVTESSFQDIIALSIYDMQNDNTFQNTSNELITDA